MKATTKMSENSGSMFEKNCIPPQKEEEEKEKKAVKCMNILLSWNYVKVFTC
jgi:hypothetical protein